MPTWVVSCARDVCKPLTWTRQRLQRHRPHRRDDIALAFWNFAQTHYRRPDGTPTGEAENFRLAIRALRKMYGSVPATATKDGFGPKRLELLRASLLAEREQKDPTTDETMKVPGWCRTYANRQVKRIQQIFRWAASEELISPAVSAALDTVKGIHKGSAGARESSRGACG